jgi:hypothetical protein
VEAHYQILTTFFGALVLASGSLETFGLNDLGMGALLLSVNLVTAIAAGGMSYDRWRRQRAELGWRKPLDSQVTMRNIYKLLTSVIVTLRSVHSYFMLLF